MPAGPAPEAGAPSGKGAAAPPGRVRRPWLRVALLVIALAAATALAWATGVHEWLRPERLARLRAWIAGYGAWGPAVYVAGYVLAELVFLPAIPLAVLSGVAFGPLWGTVYASIGATLAAAAAFLVARHLARDAVARWIAGAPRLARIDAALERHGWRVLVVTRVLPIFPFNVQNFAYGVTRIRFRTFVLVSWLSMLPGTAALTIAGGAVVQGESLGRVTWMLAAAGLLVVAASVVVPRLVGRTAAGRALLPAGDPRRP